MNETPRLLIRAADKEVPVEIVLDACEDFSDRDGVPEIWERLQSDTPWSSLYLLADEAKAFLFKKKSEIARSMNNVNFLAELRREKNDDADYIKYLSERQLTSTQQLALAYVTKPEEFLIHLKAKATEIRHSVYRYSSKTNDWDRDAMKYKKASTESQKIRKMLSDWGDKKLIRLWNKEVGWDL